MMFTENLVGAPRDVKKGFGMRKIASVLRAGALASALAFGLLTAGPVMAQDTANQPAEEDDGGFDDWGLLGLLGLAGLAGLRKREPEVRRVEGTTIDRTNDPLR